MILSMILMGLESPPVEEKEERKFSYTLQETQDEWLLTSDPSVSLLESTLFVFFFDAAEDLDFFFDGCFVSTSSAKANKSLNLFR